MPHSRVWKIGSPHIWGDRETARGYNGGTLTPGAVHACKGSNQGVLLAFFDPDACVSQAHSMRIIKRCADAALGQLSSRRTSTASIPRLAAPPSRQRGCCKPGC